MKIPQSQLEFKPSSAFAIAAVGLFLIALLENWLQLGLAFPPLRIANNSGLALLSVLLAVLYYAVRTVESSRDTYY